MSRRIEQVNKICYVINLLSVAGGIIGFAYIAIF